MTQYSTLYERALAQITDPLLVQIPEEDLENMLHDWLMNAIVEPVVGEYDFANRDEELKQFNFDISDRDQAILAIHMVRGWLAPQIASVTLTAQVYSGKETKYYAQANHLSEMRALDADLQRKADLLFCRGTYLNNEYFD
ncbi:MAG: hypothetical protein UHD64_08025 [Bacteroidales bacterium]|nr:hypothetical protein [Bacteroidales bacterium]